jgi:hypothetical protein
MKTNKPVRVSINGRHQGYIDLHRTFLGRVWFLTKWFMKKVAWGMSLSLIAMLLWVGGQMNPGNEVIPTVEAESNLAPILQRISNCETTGNPNKAGSHWDKNGQVLMRSNVNKSVDVGLFQINSVWFKKATEMGLDITKEADNTKMAQWIYENRGTGDWSSSANCWRK